MRECVCVSVCLHLVCVCACAVLSPACTRHRDQSSRGAVHPRKDLPLRWHLLWVGDPPGARPGVRLVTVSPSRVSLQMNLLLSPDAAHKPGGKPWCSYLLPRIESLSTLWSVPWTSLTPASCPHHLSPGPRGGRLRWGSPTPSHSPCRRSPRLKPSCLSMACQIGLNSLSRLRVPLRCLPRGRVPVDP